MGHISEEEAVKIVRKVYRRATTLPKTFNAAEELINPQKQYAYMPVTIVQYISYWDMINERLDEIDG